MLLSFVVSTTLRDNGLMPCCFMASYKNQTSICRHRHSTQIQQVSQIQQGSPDAMQNCLLTNN